MLTCDAHFVQLPKPLVHSLPRDVVSQANGRERDEAEVERLQEVPVLLQAREDGSGDEQEAGNGQDGEHAGVDDGHHRLGQTPLPVDVRDGPTCTVHHDPLHGRREEEEGEGDANSRVDDAEGLSTIGEWRRVAITCRRERRMRLLITAIK